MAVAAAIPAGFFTLNDLLYSNATTFGTGTELWRSDGTAAGTVLVKDLCASSNCSGSPRPR